MAKGLPWMPLYVADWLGDEDLSFCSPATRGIWIDALAVMHKRDRCGMLRDSVHALARVCRCNPEEMLAALRELRDRKAAEVEEHTDGTWTLVNRRMQREDQERQANADRVRKHRQQKRGQRGGNSDDDSDNDPRKPQPDKDVTPPPNNGRGGCNSDVTLQSPEFRVVKSSSVLTDLEGLSAFAREKLRTDDDDFQKLKKLAGERLPELLDAMATLLAEGTRIKSLTRYARTLLTKGIAPDLINGEHGFTVWRDRREEAERRRREAEEREERERPLRERKAREAQEAREQREREEANRNEPLADAFTSRAPADQDEVIASWRKSGRFPAALENLRLHWLERGRPPWRDVGLANVVRTSLAIAESLARERAPPATTRA